MKIGYLYDFEAYPPRGGNHVHAYEITQRLIDQGHEVFVLDDPTMPRTQSFSGTEAGVRQLLNKIELLYIRIDGRSLSSWPAAMKAMELAGDVPVVWEINAPANERLAYSWLGGRDLKAAEGSVRRLRRWVHAARQCPAILREERLRRRLARRVSGAICVSESLAEYARTELGIKAVMALPNGGPLISDEELAQRRARREDSWFTVFYSGSAMYPWQGLDYLAATIELAAEKAPDVRFVLAVNQRIPALPSSANVQILEGLDRDGILDAICASDVCVSLHPDYSWSPYGFHNSPMKLFEYMACGVPVIASAHGQMRQLFESGGGGLLTANEPRAVLQQILRLRDDAGQARKIGEEGLARVRDELNWPQNALRSAVFFERMAGAEVLKATEERARSRQVIARSVGKVGKLVSRFRPLPGGDGMIIVAGMPKSGTTAIAKLLGAAAGRSVCSDPFYRLDKVSPESRHAVFRQPGTLRRVWQSHRAIFAGQLVKDPNFPFLLDELVAMFPQARFVFIVRDPRDNIRSVLDRLKLPGQGAVDPMLIANLTPGWRSVICGENPLMPGVNHIEKMAWRWRLAVEKYREHAGNITLVRYEDFVRNKRSYIEQLAHSLGHAVVCDISELVDVQYQPKGKSQRDWRVFFGEENLARINSIVEPYLSEFGYDFAQAATAHSHHEHSHS